MWRDPYVAGVERFEFPLWRQMSPINQAQYKEQAALFCLLLWEQFQSDVRALRYHINFERSDDATFVFEQPPYHEELIQFDTHNASQIDIEFVSQQPAPLRKYTRLQSAGKDEHFPAFLEVFVPLRPHSSECNDIDTGSPKLIIWCQPSLLSRVTDLWQQSSALLLR